MPPPLTSLFRYVADGAILITLSLHADTASDGDVVALSRVYAPSLRLLMMLRCCRAMLRRACCHCYRAALMMRCRRALPL